MAEDNTICTTASFPLAIVLSKFNEPITDELKRGALQRLKETGFKENDILVIEVPGAIEIPIIAKQIAMREQAKIIIALGAVIRGETTHYDYVCQQVSYGCQKVALEHNLPVIFGVLTTETPAQAWERLGGKKGHKGISAVNCAIKMHSILSQLRVPPQLECIVEQG